jgi:carboxypeptidase Taq
MRYEAHSFRDGFFAMLHEVGHGLYDQGLDRAHYGTPMGEAASLGMHESQSRLWENFVGRGLPFWKHFFPRMKNVFPESMGNVSLDAFHRAINAVEPTLDRSTSDEVHYNLHIFIRFQLELALLNGSLAAADLPEAWRAAYQRELGIEPRSDAEGCLQDGHWAQALIGYFPTYTLGNIYAAQLMAAARTQIPGFDESFSRGEFGDLLAWLRQHVHRHGQRYPAAELVRRATGALPSHAPLVEHLRSRYADINAN